MGVDPDIAFSKGDLMRRIRDLETKVRELTAGRRLENSAVGKGGIRVHQGGGVTVEDGGRMIATASTGAEVWYVGPLVIGDPPVNYEGMVLRQPDGAPIFYTFPPQDDPDELAWRWIDGQGHEVLSSDALNGGLARPWIPLQGLPVLSSAIPMTSNGTFIGVWSSGYVVKQQPFAEVAALLRSDSGGVGQARYTLNGVPVGSTMTINDGDFLWQAFQLIPLTGETYVDNARVELEVRRTNGVGTVGGVFSGSQRQS